MLYLCADGGGTKLQLLAFDEQLRLLAHVRGPAVTALYIPADVVRENTLATLRQLEDALPADAPRTPDGRLRVKTIYQSSIGCQAVDQVIGQVAEVGENHIFSESGCGLMAGVGRQTGILTLAGTGSDCFYVRDGECALAVGGYGPILGDEGSGYDLGRQTLLAAIHADEDRGEPTVLRDMVFEDYGLKVRMFELVSIVHSSPDTRKQVARATYTLARAVRAGDAVARRILSDGGRRLANDTVAVLRKSGLGADCALPATVAGGAWKIHPLMWRTFKKHLLEACPQLQLIPPAFDPVMAGVVYTVLHRDGALTAQRLAQLKAEFAPLVLDKYFAGE